jgi:hypothetical protein
MKPLLLAAVLALAVPALPLLAPAAAAQTLLPDTDEAAAAAARDTLAGGTWTGSGVNIDNVAYDLSYSFSASGRGVFSAKDPTGKGVAFSTLWGVVKAEAGGDVTLVVAFLVLEDGGAISYEEEPMILTGRFTPEGKFAGTMKFEGEAAVELTRQ